MPIKLPVNQMSETTEGLTLFRARGFDRNFLGQSLPNDTPTLPLISANQLVLQPILRCLPSMDFPSQNPEYGFQFPGVFEIAAMGTAGVGLEEQVPQMLEAAGIIVFRETFSSRASSGGKYVSIRISFEAQDRTQYETAHRTLRENPDVKWTL